MKKRIYSSLKAGLLVVLSLLISTTGAAPVLAEDPTTLRYYSYNNIVFYDNETIGCGAPSDPTADEIAATPDSLVPEVAAAKKIILRNASVVAAYKEVGDKKNVPWQLLGILHYREHTNKLDNPGNGQGSFGFYGSNLTEAKRRGLYLTPGPITIEQMKAQAEFAADIFRGKAGGNASGLTKTTASFDVLGPAFFGYNGRAKVYIEQALKLGFTQQQADQGMGSPYVVNFLSPKQSPSNPQWGQIKTDGGPISYPAGRQVGTWTLFAALAGVEIEYAGDCSTGGATGINPNSPRAQRIVKEALATPLGINIGQAKKLGYVPTWYSGAWCAAYASTIYKRAGATLPGGRDGIYVSTSDMLRVFSRNSAKFVVVKPYEAKPQPGDFIWWDDRVHTSKGQWEQRYQQILNGSAMQHTALVVAVNGNLITTREGNAGGGETQQNTYNFIPGTSRGWTGQIFAFGRLKE